MKLEIHNDQHASLLARYLSSEMGDTERHSFEKQFVDDGENDDLIDFYRTKFGYEFHGTSPRQPDVEPAWDKLRTRISIDGLLPVPAGNTSRFNRALTLKIAAVFVFLFSLGVILFWNNRNNSQETALINILTANDPVTLVKTLPDGSIVYLSPLSGFSYPVAFRENSRSVSMEGEAFFDIQHNPRQPFIIETKNATIEVLGTAFNIRNRTDHDFELEVERGKVKVTMKSDPSNPVFVNRGEMVKAYNDHLVKSVSKPDVDPWYRKKMHFKEETLQHIVNVLNRNFGVTFVLQGEDIASRKLTLTCDEGVDKITELICLVLNLKSQSKGDTIILSEQNPTRN